MTSRPIPNFWQAATYFTDKLLRGKCFLIATKYLKFPEAIIPSPRRFLRINNFVELNLGRAKTLGENVTFLLFS